ncbi:flavodoxin family protein [Dactylosporangium darangshiense]|uniref:flavodoxin family protein n=1 Tax=Dactylosporangium darangshiense TaxID=579108 RepID=UPI00363B49CC
MLPEEVPAPPSSERLGREVLAALTNHDVDGEVIRVADHDVRFGVSTDDDGDAWPHIRVKLLDAQILVIATPIWMGQPASVCKVVLERLDADLSGADEQGRLRTYDKVAVVGMVGNEAGRTTYKPDMHHDFAGALGEPDLLVAQLPFEHGDLVLQSEIPCPCPGHS